MAIKVLVFHALVSLLLFKTSWAGEPIVEIGDVQPKVSAYTFDGARKPLLLQTVDEIV